MRICALHLLELTTVMSTVSNLWCEFTAMSSYKCLALPNLLEWVKDAVAPRRDLWAFLNGATTSDEDATTMAKFLAEAFETASRYHEDHVVICEALVKPGLRSSTRLPSNHKSSANGIVFLLLQYGLDTIAPTVRSWIRVAVMYTVGVIFGAKGICTVGSMHIR